MVVPRIHLAVKMNQDSNTNTASLVNRGKKGSSLHGEGVQKLPFGYLT